MKISIDDLKNTYSCCIRSGLIKEKVPDIELARNLRMVAEKGLGFIRSISKSIPDDSPDWTFVFRDYYESLRGLIEAYLLIEGIKADNHQCKNAYICFSFPDLELDWNFLETVRLKRNAINYRGQMLRYIDWKAFELNFDLHINLLLREIDDKLKT